MVFTYPNIEFVLGKLSQFISDPAKHHGYALKKLLQYINSIIKQKLRLGPWGAYNYMVVSLDANWASNKLDRKSISGSVAMFYGGLISWSSKKQQAVSTSSCESEYIALSACTKQGQWFTNCFQT
jgi:hypothetical protein